MSDAKDGLRLTHVDDSGRVSMVDVGGKPAVPRTAVAESFIRLQPETLRLIAESKLAKGEIFATARLAGIMAAKATSQLIPLCHPLPLTKVGVDLEPTPEGIRITATASLRGQTGVEMEALTAASIAALTIYDMAKAVDKTMEIGPTRLVSKNKGEV